MHSSSSQLITSLFVVSLVLAQVGCQSGDGGHKGVVSNLDDHFARFHEDVANAGGKLLDLDSSVDKVKELTTASLTDSVTTPANHVVSSTTTLTYANSIKKNSNAFMTSLFKRYGNNGDVLSYAGLIRLFVKMGIKTREVSK